MIPIQSLFESHLTVNDQQRSMSFFGEVLGLEIAEVFLDRKVAFYWIGGRGGTMLGLWEVTAPPAAKSSHRVSSRSSGSVESAGISSRRQHYATRLCGKCDH
jgi:hypothetical protein